MNLDLLTTLKKNWILIIDFAIIMVVFLTDIIKPPYISENISLSALNIVNASKFIVVGVLIFLGILVAYLSERKHIPIYITLSIIALISTSVALLFYLSSFNKFTAYNSLKKQRYIIGREYTKEAKEAIAEMRKQEPNLLITPQLMLEGYGDPHDIWYPSEIEEHAKKLVFQYLMIVASASCFILTGLQSFNILSSKKEEHNG